MTDSCPSVVRLAKSTEQEELFFLLKQMHAEIGMFSFSEPRVQQLLASVLDPNAPKLTTPVVIGVIGPPRDIQATICLMFGRVYYTDECHLGDCWTFVRADCRQSGHARALIDFGKMCAEEMGIPFMSNIVCTKQTEAKMRLYRRRFGEPIGGYFIHRPQEQRRGDA